MEKGSLPAAALTLLNLRLRGDSVPRYLHWTAAGFKEHEA
jgi:hypothetical protein